MEAFITKEIILEDERREQQASQYLEDVVNRLFDVTEALQALLGVANKDKIQIATHGQNFVYQQGIIDVATELLAYAQGVRSLQEDKEALLESVLLEVKNNKKPKQDAGMFQ